MPWLLRWGEARRVLGPRGERRGPSTTPFRQGLAFPAGFGEAGHPLGWIPPAFSPAGGFPSATEAVSAYSCIVHSPHHAFLAFLPPAGPSGPRRSPVTGQGAKSLFAKHSPSPLHFLLALPLSLRMQVQGTLPGRPMGKPRGQLWGRPVGGRQLTRVGPWAWSWVSLGVKRRLCPQGFPPGR